MAHRHSRPTDVCCRFLSVHVFGLVLLLIALSGASGSIASYQGTTSFPGASGFSAGSNAAFVASKADGEVLSTAIDKYLYVVIKKKLGIVEHETMRVKNSSLDQPVSYITTVGLYSADNELLAVAKLSKPVLKSTSREALIKVRLDF